MKILLVNDYGIKVGGAEIIVFGLRDSLRCRGHDVRVFSSLADSKRRSPIADDTCFGTTSRWRTLLQTLNPAAAFQMRRVIHNFSPDIVHLNLYLTQLSPLILWAMRGVPVVHYVQWYRTLCPLGTRHLPKGSSCQSRQGLICLLEGCVPPRDIAPRLLQMVMDRHLARHHITNFIAISHTVATALRKYGHPNQRSAVVLYPGTAVVEPRQGMTSEPTVVTAGRLVMEKGVQVLIEAFALVASKHPTVKLQVIGDGPARADLEQRVAQLNLRQHVIFAGLRSHTETMEAIRAAWVVCVPSLWMEPFGMIAVEAQMQGVAVVASRIGGLSEIVVDGITGHLVAPGDCRALAMCLQGIFAEPGRTHAMGRAAHQHARIHFSLEKSADQWEDAYNSLIMKKKQICTQDASNQDRCSN